MLSEYFLYLIFPLSAIGGYSYVRDTWRGDAQPNRVTWILWAVAPMIAFFGSLDEGAGLHASLTFFAGFIPILVLIASFANKKAYWRITSLDIICGAISAIALAAYVATGDGNIAVALGITADGLAAIPTIIKCYQDPESESPLLYWLTVVQATIVLLTINQVTFANAAFNVYLGVAFLLMATLVTFKVGERLRPKRAVG